MLLIAFMAFGFFTTPALALAEEEKAFVDLYTISALMLYRCPGYERDNDTPMKVADKMGVDGVKVWDASRAAFMANLDLEYDKADLIPEVTRELKRAVAISASSVQDGSICKEVDNFVKSGWLLKKKN
jgi:hypothetical protein